MSNAMGIIPARYGSTRLLGKPLLTIHGKSLIQHTYENAKRCLALQQILVATDDERIFAHVKGFGGEVVMTSTSCQTGSDRLAEVVREYSHIYPELAKAEIIVNIQGDEPLVDPSVIEGLAKVLQRDHQAEVATAIKEIQSEEEALLASCVKCVIDKSGYALYFSRGLIPMGKNLKYETGRTYYKHIGIYGYRKAFLLEYGKLAATPLQLAEDLEQLKILEQGFRIKTLLVDKECVDVNTLEDIKKVEQLLCKQNSFL